MLMKVDTSATILHLVGTPVYQTHRYSIPGRPMDLVFVRSRTPNEKGEYDVVTSEEMADQLKSYVEGEV